MIVSAAHRFVYIGIPKAASQSVARWLIDDYGGSPVGYHHAWQVPPELRGFLVFTVVRNPYERCFSAWWYRCGEPSRRHGNPIHGWTFTQFMGAVLAAQQRTAGAEPSGTEAAMTQKRFYDLSGATVAVQLERPEDLARLPFVHTPPSRLPRENETRTKPAGRFGDHFGPAEEQLVWDYCAEDFAAFSYPRQSFDARSDGGNPQRSPV